MQVAVFALNREGYQLAVKLKDGLRHQVFVYGYTRAIRSRQPLSRLVAQVWDQVDGLVFFTATGIALRTIAPLLKNKVTDPAVLVIDARGQFVISLLSGHLGGANQLAREVAHLLGATPVITTATDVMGKTSVEEWASKRGLKVANSEGLVKINSAILRDEPVTVYTELSAQQYAEEPLVPGKTFFKSLEGLPSSPPKGVSMAITRGKLGVGGVDLELVVPTLAVGIGCKRGTGKEAMKELIQEVFKEKGWPLAAVKQLVSVEQKRNEKGLLALARELRVSLCFYLPEELAGVLEAMPQLKKSPFVERKIGVGAVCEPAAILGSGWGRLLMGKRVCQGVTVAVAQAGSPLLGSAQDYLNI